MPGSNIYALWTKKAIFAAYSNNYPWLTKK